ncbi:MAG: VOC family protein [Acidimicrobiales bacterium]
MPTYTVLTAAEVAALPDLGDWRFTTGAIEARFRASGFAAAADLVTAIAAAADAADHHPDIDVRYPGVVHVRLTTHAAGRAVTDLDVALARTISGLAADRDATPDPTAAQVSELALDALDIGAVLPFWRAVLGYVDDVIEGQDEPLHAIKDPLRIGPPLWFQQMDEPRTERNRFHLDVIVPHDEAEGRLAAALAAGGTLVSDEYAKAWWILADAEGNEACICTWQDREVG